MIKVSQKDLQNQSRGDIIINELVCDKTRQKYNEYYGGEYGIRR